MNQEFKEVTDHITDFYSTAGKKLVPQLNLISKVFKSHQYEQYNKPITPASFRKLKIRQSLPLTNRGEQVAFKTPGREQLYKQDTKKGKSPCIGMYSPKFTLIDRTQSFSFSKLEKKKGIVSDLIPEGPPLTKGELKKEILKDFMKNKSNIISAHIPNLKFSHQLERKDHEISVNDKRFDFMPKLRTTTYNIHFSKLKGRQDLFKLPEFLHEYYITLAKSPNMNYLNRRSNSKEGAENLIIR